MNKNKISLIAAISENKVIGRDNQLPWHIPEDLKRFKELTKGHPIIMGRKTFESIGRPLPKRTNIIITRDASFDPHKFCLSEKCDMEIIVCNSLEEALRSAETKPGHDEAFVIGGGQIFHQAISMADKLYLTIVHTTIEGDAFFPDYTLFTKKTFEQGGESNGFRYTFVDLERE